MAKNAKSHGYPEEVEPVKVEEAAPKKLTAKERLKQKATKAVPAASQKKAREVILLEGSENAAYAEAVDRLTAAIHGKKVIEGHAKTAQSIVLPHVKGLILRDWVEEEQKTENKRIQTPSGSSFILQCKDTLSGARGFRVPKSESGDPIAIQDHLQSNGVPKNLVTKLMDDGEFTEELVVSVNIAKLEKEHANLAERLMELIDAAGSGGVTTSDGTKIKFTDDEMKKMLTENNDVTVKPGFLGRSVSHCLKAATNEDGTDKEKAVQMLTALLTAVPPQWAVGQALCLHPDEGIMKLLHEKPQEEVVAAPVLPVFHKTADNKFILRVEGVVITVLRAADDKELAKKTCKDAMHTTNTVKKWQREPATLSAFIAENM